VSDGAQNEKLAAWSGPEPAVIMNIQRQPGANVIAVVDAIKAMMPQLQATLPQAIDIKVLSDRTTTIRASVEDVQFELAVAIALVVMVIFVFLRNVPATVIPALSVPLSIVGTFGVMYLAGFSINNLSLMALTIATGFVVDDAIVMIENIARYLEEGDAPKDAALKGARQIGFTIVSLTVSLIAVLIPLLFMRDVVGRLFREFAITLAVTILISALVSLTLVPMMCARLLKSHGQEPAKTPHGGAWFKGVLLSYQRSLDWVLDRRGLVLLVALGTFALTVGLYVWVPKGLFPVQDTGLIQAISQAPESVSFSDMARRQQALAAVVLKDPEVDTLSSFIGVDGANLTLNTGRLLIVLKPQGQRRSAVSEVIRRINASVASVQGIRLFMQPVQDLTIDTTASRTQYSFVLEDADPAEIERWTPNLLERLASVPQIEDVGTDLQQQGLATYVTIDRSTAARFGITPATVDNALYDAYGQRIVSTIFTQNNQYRVILEADPQLQTSPSDLSQVYLPSSTASSGSGQVPLSAISSITEKRMPLLINHLGQFPSAVVSFNLARGASLGQAVELIGDALKKADQPASIFVVFQGAAQAFQQALSNEVYLLLAAIVTVYIVLGVLYESYIHPLTILSTLPSAGIGALLALRLAGNDLDIIGIIGIVLLIGIVKKNAIMMIDFALEAERERGLPAVDAIREACLLRLRPILMTTFAAIFGALPLMLGTGVGSELRHPLGLTIVGGLILSQILTLYTTPVIYLAFDWLARRFGKVVVEPEADAAS
jgi:multidrug efflux pump